MYYPSARGSRPAWYFLIPLAVQLQLTRRRYAPLQPIFQDENGMAIKFFIQKDIPHDIQTEVCEAIAVSFAGACISGASDELVLSLRRTAGE